MISTKHEQAQAAAAAAAANSMAPSKAQDALLQDIQPVALLQQDDCVDLKVGVVPASAAAALMDVEKMDKQQKRRRSSKLVLASRQDADALLENESVKDEWNKELTVSSQDNMDALETFDAIESEMKELPRQGQEVLQVAACLGTFEYKLLKAATSLKSDELSTHLAVAADKDIIKSVNGVYMFSNDRAERCAYKLIPADKRTLFHSSIGRHLVRKLSHDELETHMSTVLLQFHRGMQDVTSRNERIVIAGLCLRATRLAVANSDFGAACHYSELGIHLMGEHCWEDDYELSLALHNASAEVLHCTGNSEKVDTLVAVVLKNARCYRDTLQIRATRIHSLSSRYRMGEALDEALDILRHLGERFPSKPRKHHVLLEFLRTKRALRGRTNEMILRMPLMENTDKLAAMQILNLIFPIAYHTNSMLNALFATRMVQLTMNHGLSAISTVGFASYSSMLAAFSSDLEERYRFSQLALEVLARFDAKEYLPRVHIFVYAEVLPYKLALRDISKYLLQAHHVGLETGDTEFAMIAATMYAGYTFFSGEKMASIEEETARFCKVAVGLKLETALCLLRPDLKILQILMGKIEIPSDMLKADMDRALEADDKSSVCVIHFLQTLLAYIFCDFEEAAEEARGVEDMLRLPYIHPGLSCLLTFHCLALLAVTPQRHGRGRRRLLSAVNKSIKKLTQFSLSVPENGLDSLNLVQAERLVAVGGDTRLARSKYLISISLATKFNNLMIHSIACERFALFLRAQGDETAAARSMREAYITYSYWGAMAKVQQLDQDISGLLTLES